MKGVDKLSLTAGIIMTIGGLFMLIISIFVWPLFVYGVIVLVLGIVILLTLKQQEYIEPIKTKGIKDSVLISGKPKQKVIKREKK
jgi:hypothetical protein